MRTLLLAIVSGAGIATVIFIIFLFTSLYPLEHAPIHDWKIYREIDTPGLNDTYQVNQTIQFTVLNKGYGDRPCLIPDVVIYNNDNPDNPVFRVKGGVIECPLQTQFENYSLYYPSKINPFVTSINKAGNYTLSISFGDISILKKFSVMSPHADKNSNNDSSKEYGTTSLPPPFSVKNMGSKATTLDDALNQAGFTQDFVPTYIPDDLALDSTRVILDPNGNRILILYMPNGQSVTDETSIQEVIDRGMAVEISREQKDPNFNWDDFVKQSVKENPTIRSSSIINNHEVLLVRNNPEINYPNMVKVMTDDIRIEIASDLFDTSELEQVMRSMLNS